MTDASTRLPYDPALPFAVTTATDSSTVIARFATAIAADHYAEEIGGEWYDTTPGPDIPEGAEYIIWDSRNTGAQYVAKRTEPGEDLWVMLNGQGHAYSPRCLPGATPETEIRELRVVAATPDDDASTCDACGEPATEHYTELAEPVHLCGSCENNALRSGWRPGQE